MNTCDTAPPVGVRRLPTLLWLIAAAYLAFVGWKMADGYRDAARGEVPFFTDYTPTYGASMLVRAVPAEFVYLQRAMSEAGREAARAQYGEISDEQAKAVGFSPFMYPPTFILLIAPLAYLPYLLSWVAWIGLTAVPFTVALRRILPGPLALPFAFAAPPAFYNLIYGQTGFLVAGLLGLGCTLLQRRPVLAGIVIGLASVKPHFGILVPVALIAGRHRAAAASATVTVVATVALSVLAFGGEPWFAFVGTAAFHLQGFEHGAYNLQVMASVLSAVRLSGASMDWAWAVQIAVSLSLAGVVAWVWSGRDTTPRLAALRNAILFLAAVLAAPSAYLYDLVLLVPAAAWLWQAAGEDGKVADQWFVAAAMAALILVRPVAEHTGIQTGPVIVCALLAVALQRYRQGRLQRSGTPGYPVATGG